ncbi:hypothetical protein BDV26DRAFT_257113 [Aspergillus bertholletiae]|uniref:Uncharacterized protein n=1 Tax=Aspergillus bertholletiae TaxID=1226010 RepID=A0A5N7BFV6_9EURO|nr:hypothetical protein BDV26DRAFT_257113 [Aspergillus bertholletiae]
MCPPHATKATVILSILVFSLFSTNVAGADNVGFRPSYKRPMYPKDPVFINGLCYIVTIPADHTERPRQVCKVSMQWEYRLGFHIPHNIHEYYCDYDAPCTESGREYVVTLKYETSYYGDPNELVAVECESRCPRRVRTGRKIKKREREDTGWR